MKILYAEKAGSGDQADFPVCCGKSADDLEDRKQREIGQGTDCNGI